MSISKKSYRLILTYDKTRINRLDNFGPVPISSIQDRVQKLRRRRVRSTTSREYAAKAENKKGFDDHQFLTILFRRPMH